MENIRLKESLWWCDSIKKKCPECGAKAVKLYQNKSIEGKRKWIPISWYCTSCNYTYKVASDILIYKLGDETYKESFKEKCPKCDLGLVRLYRHINPKHGKQRWVSMGWYCTRCRYVWMDEKTPLMIRTLSNIFFVTFIQ